ncbi:hypothetical protein BDZ91DRAFT_557554 [Kalaharituber pfeilii]|nr:hypothetical protein BDZ91DRAFT_557554 [Kalaharituber pfeilii]
MLLILDTGFLGEYEGALKSVDGELFLVLRGFSASMVLACSPAGGHWFMMVSYYSPFVLLTVLSIQITACCKNIERAKGMQQTTITFQK